MTPMQPQAGQVVTVFRNRLRPDADPAYSEELAVMGARVREIAGFVESKTFTAADGERVTVVTFADQAGHDAWRTDGPHRTAQRHGVTDYYTECAVQVGTVQHASSWRA